MSNKWTVLFNTDDEMIHPVRFEWSFPKSESEVTIVANAYLAKHSWLKSVEEVYPTQSEGANIN